MFCKKCGNMQKKGEKFCPKCGTPYIISLNDKQEKISKSSTIPDTEDECDKSYAEETVQDNIHQEDDNKVPVISKIIKSENEKDDAKQGIQDENMAILEDDGFVNTSRMRIVLMIVGATTLIVFYVLKSGLSANAGWNFLAGLLMAYSFFYKGYLSENKISNKKRTIIVLVLSVILLFVAPNSSETSYTKNETTELSSSTSSNESTQKLSKYSGRWRGDFSAVTGYVNGSPVYEHAGSIYLTIRTDGTAHIKQTIIQGFREVVILEGDCYATIMDDILYLPTRDGEKMSESLKFQLRNGIIYTMSGESLSRN